MRDVRIQLDTGDRSAIDIALSRIVPFDVKLTAQVVWDSVLVNLLQLMSGQKPNPASYMYTNDQLTQDAVICIHGPSHHVDFRGCTVSQRYAGPDQVSFVSTSVIDPFIIGGKPLDGAALQITDWLTVSKPSDPRFKTTADRAAQIHRRVILTPIVHHRSQYTAVQVQELAKLVLQLATLNPDIRAQQVDSWLLDASIKARKERSA